MPARSFASGSVFGGEPAHVAKIADIAFVADDSFEDFEQPFIDRENEDREFAFLTFGNSLPYPCGWPELLADCAAMDAGSRLRCFCLVLAIIAVEAKDRAEGDIGVVTLAPFHRQPVEGVGFRIWAWVEIERPELFDERNKLRRIPGGEPVMLQILAVAFVEFVFRRRECVLVGADVHGRTPRTRRLSNSRRTTKLRAIEMTVKTTPIPTLADNGMLMPNHGNTMICDASATP